MRETEEEKQKQSKKIITSLAELNVLNKELRSLNHHYFEVNKKFEALFRRYMQKYGRTKVSSSDQNTFAQLIKDRKQVDYSSIVNSSLGNPFIRFMRLNFNSIKTEEVNFYTELKNIKDKAARSSNLGFTKGFEFNSEDDQEQSASENSSQEASDNQSHSVKPHHKQHLPEADHSPVKDSGEKPSTRPKEQQPGKLDSKEIHNIKGKSLTIEIDSGANGQTGRSAKHTSKAPTPASHEPARLESSKAGGEPLVEKIKIERTKSSDEEH